MVNERKQSVETNVVCEKEYAVYQLNAVEYVRVKSR